MSKKRRVPKSLQAMIAKQQCSSYTERVLSRQQASLHKEVDYILQHARAGDSRVVGFGQLLFFSTGTRDAWMLDWEDELAICLMKDGVLQSCELGETDRKFAIKWQGRYHIQGDFFSYIDNMRPTRAQIIHGYPTDVILKTIERLRQGI
jgi:hypothetical protein